jgi:hypothetical protein
VGDWLVAGWFTPNYRPLAAAFAAQLDRHDAPYHLYAKTYLQPGWQTTLKPSVVLEAMQAYPGKTVILMDVDCRVNGDLSPMLAGITGDVGIVVTAADAPKGKKGRQHWVSIETSSRVVVFRPTAGARRFAERWAAQIARSSFDHDEYSMAWAYLRSPDVSFAYIPRAYSAREVGIVPGAIVAHDSAHSKERTATRGTIANALRAFERRFLRTGRTRKAKQHLQPEAILQ